MVSCEVEQVHSWAAGGSARTASQGRQRTETILHPREPTYRTRVALMQVRERAIPVVPATLPLGLRDDLPPRILEQFVPALQRESGVQLGELGTSWDRRAFTPRSEIETVPQGRGGRVSAREGVPRATAGQGRRGDLP